MASVTNTISIAFLADGYQYMRKVCSAFSRNVLGLKATIQEPVLPVTDDHGSHKWPARSDELFFHSEIRVASLCLCSENADEGTRRACVTRAQVIAAGLCIWIEENGGHQEFERDLAELATRINATARRLVPLASTKNMSDVIAVNLERPGNTPAGMQ